MGAIVTKEEVKAWAKRPQTADELVDAVVDAVEAVLARVFTVPTYGETTPPPADLKLALWMQCARLLTRQDSPNGIVPGFEGGALRISRFDPDIDQLIPLARRACLA